ncbi:hypothetical protein SK128_028286 [Halocaridina rubra]|uniref:Uncharacterized protein n=1 Tax=Halocaridina rubra TaxID=373956 RepID=A0AAN8ZU41_HALRR
MKGKGEVAFGDVTEYLPNILPKKFHMMTSSFKVTHINVSFPVNSVNGREGI